MAEPLLDQLPDKLREDDLARVRALLLGSDYEELLTLKQSLDDPAEFTRKLADVIVESIRLRIKSDNALSVVLSPMIGDAIQRSIQNNPHAISNALYPVMGPTIRRSISETLAQMLESINLLLEQGLSPKSLRWRFDAWRTGKNYAEVLLANTLEYQVEQIFLIHDKSSLLIGHLVAEMAVTKDPDLVSAMLSAIQDFIQDSFTVSSEDRLDSMRLGDLTVIIERGPEASVAAVVRGSVPHELRTMMTETLEMIHRSSAHRLAEFSGNPADMLDVIDALQPCMMLKRLDNKVEKKKKPWLAIFVLLGLIAALAYQAYEQRLLGANQQRIIDHLSTTPGLVVIQSEAYLDGRLVVSGLRDSLAEDPQIQAQRMIDTDLSLDFEFRPYLSAEPEILIKRAIARLSPPPSIELKVVGSALYLSGVATVIWHEAVLELWPNIYGLESINYSGLMLDDVNRVELKRMIAEIESKFFHFERAATETMATQVEIAAFANEITEFAVLAAGQRLQPQIVIKGFTDETGTTEFNAKISQQRIEKFQSLLIETGVAREIFNSNAEMNITALGTTERKVAFSVTGIDADQLLNPYAAEAQEK